MFSRALASWKNLIGWKRKESSAGGERRVWVRHASNLETSYQPAHDPDAGRLSVRVRDVSSGGISLAVDRPFEPGELLGIELPADPGGPTSTVLACVVRSDPQPGGGWVLGSTFAAQLQDRDLQLFGATRARPDEPDQRAWVRFDCKAAATYRAVNAPEGPLLPATILNISAGGIALEVAEPLAVGALISIDVRAGDQFLFRTLACVVRVTTPVAPGAAGGGRPVLGCNFIGELADAQLRALVQ
jgi:hypothetical protein